MSIMSRQLYAHSCKVFTLPSVLCMIVILLSSTLSITCPSCIEYTESLGYTQPAGDIFVELNKPLEILCILNDKMVNGYGENASSYITFKRNDITLPSSSVTVVNSSVARLYIEELNKLSEELYKCLVNGTTVCSNLVSVATKPQRVTDFQCLGINYYNFTCQWTVPANVTGELKTTYQLDYNFTVGMRIWNNSCIVHSTKVGNRTKYHCFWGMLKDPLYHPGSGSYTFFLLGSNSLGTTNQTIKIDTDKYMRSSPPTNLNVIEKTVSSIHLQWTKPLFMGVYKTSLDYRVLYQCEYSVKEWCLAALIENSSDEKIDYNLTGLQHPYELCDIRVSARSFLADKTYEILWSANVSITQRTKGRKPELPPRTDLGSFFIRKMGNSFYNVEIYFQPIDEAEKNGPNFGYDIIRVHDNETVNIEPATVTRFCATFDKLLLNDNYTFHLWSKNTYGRSIEKSTLFIADQGTRAKNAFNFVKYVYDGNQYGLTWQTPAKQSIQNYTIYWCKTQLEHQCIDKLNWMQIPKHLTTHNITMLPKNTTFLFAISVNDMYSSSGMTWAGCTVFSRNVGKMKNVWIHRLGSTFMQVNWKLDCSEMVGGISAFVVYYCPIYDIHEPTCAHNQSIVRFEGGLNVNSGNITGLQPYTTYMVTIGIVAVSTDYVEQSDPLFNTTLEAAPSTPPINVTVVDVTNKSISLTWKPPPITNGMIKYYSVHYNGQKRSVGAATNVTLLNLDSYKHYSISIKACTTLCSNMSSPISVTTKMGYPQKIQQPSVSFQNGSYITITWDNADEEVNTAYGSYQVQMIKKYQSNNETLPMYTTKDNVFTITDCGDNGKYNTFYTLVRAVNTIDGNTFVGPWSEPLESYCNVSTNYMIYILSTAMIILLVGVYYLTRRSYKQCMVMKNVEVKLPPGLTPMITEHILDQMSTNSSDLGTEQSCINYEVSTTVTDTSNSSTYGKIQPTTKQPMMEAATFICPNQDEINEKSYVSCTLLYTSSTNPTSYVMTGDVPKPETDKPYVAWNVPCR